MMSKNSRKMLEGSLFELTPKAKYYYQKHFERLKKRMGADKNRFFPGFRISIGEIGKIDSMRIIHNA